MTELVNTFSWSISAAQDFAECRRRRYWSKYAMWNGWKEEASTIQRTAYRLNKMENRFNLRGNAVERAVIWIIRQTQEGKQVTVDNVYEAAARPFLNQCWLESKKKRWQDNPKKFCCLHEHYYPKHHHSSELDMTSRIADEIKLCISNFIQKSLPGLKGIKSEHEVSVATVTSGDPENFQFEGIKIYAIPDYVYRKNDEIHIHDWKSGKPNPFHVNQMAIYGLWAHLKHNIPPDKIQVHIEYLQSAHVQNIQFGESNLQAIRDVIHYSVSEMTEYLIDGDVRRNAPLPKEDWDLAANMDICKQCKFYELCAPELV